ncbi:hypothetical protein AK812_SmicGene9257 [Symbiodinium microadriaticum]|uniref:Uncharacterized protein n=1 Tax=Symbiodinium microadriaticum TaxID=2951 RepID=A0A1Q9EIR5_SYMMI|nr:hypothetical protein AK812_SmicGene9257 [Symbiodinium microadriaticum]
MQLAGATVREHEPPENGPKDAGRDDESMQDELPQEVLEPDEPEVPVKPLSATAAFLDLMLPADSKLRDLSVLSMSEKQLVTITNRTTQKVTVNWMIAGETPRAQ